MVKQPGMHAHSALHCLCICDVSANMQSLKQDRYLVHLQTLAHAGLLLSQKVGPSSHALGALDLVYSESMFITNTL